MILATKMFPSDGPRSRALSLGWGSDVESDIANPSHHCRTRSINTPSLLSLQSSTTTKRRTEIYLIECSVDILNTTIERQLRAIEREFKFCGGVQLSWSYGNFLRHYLSNLAKRPRGKRMDIEY